MFHFYRRFLWCTFHNSEVGTNQPTSIHISKLREIVVREAILSEANCLIAFCNRYFIHLNHMRTKFYTIKVITAIFIRNHASTIFHKDTNTRHAKLTIILKLVHVGINKYNARNETSATNQVFTNLNRSSCCV